MISINIFWRKQAISALLAGGMFIGFHVSAATPEPPGLFSSSSMPDQSKAKPLKKALAGSSRAVKVNRGRLRNGRFFVNLPDGVSFEAVREAAHEHGRDRSAWVGHAAGNKRDRVIIGSSGAAMAATFSVGDRLFKLEPRADGTHVLGEVSAAEPAPELDPIPVGDGGALATDPTPVGDASADGGTVIDVLVAYTPKVQSIYGKEGAEALAIQAVAETNQAYANSGINPRLNLVAAVLTDYVESGSMSTDLSRLRGTSDGYMDEIHDLRDSYGADLVSLIEDEPRYCGYAYRMNWLSTSFATNAFSVVHRTCATGYYSFAHELGHNQGAHHDIANASGGIYPHAYGYQEPFGDFRTVMAYNCRGGCKRVDYFSNPEVIYKSQPTGILGAADNALTINKTAATVASFRQVATATPPPLPADLNALATGSSAIQLNWNDSANDESGFRLQRSVVNGNYADIASLNANKESYLDDSVAPDTVYNYRVQAWNSAGNSSFSNVATAATATAPPAIHQQASADIAVAGQVSGNYQDTWAEDKVYQTIQERLGSKESGELYAYLEHKWLFQVVTGSSVIFSAVVEANTHYDSFTFAYSTDNSHFINMFTIDRRNPGRHEFVLPASVSGNVYIRVRDTVRTTDASSHELKVDQLSIRSENGRALPASDSQQDIGAAAEGAHTGWTEATDERNREWQLARFVQASSTSSRDSRLEADAGSDDPVSTLPSTSSSANTDSLPAATREVVSASASYPSQTLPLAFTHEPVHTDVKSTFFQSTGENSAVGLFLLQAARAIPRHPVADNAACSYASLFNIVTLQSRQWQDRSQLKLPSLCRPDHQFR